MEAKFDINKPKRGLFITQKEIQDRSFKEKYKDKNLFIYSLKNPINKTYEENLILETRDAMFYMWISEEDTKALYTKIHSIIDDLILCFSTAETDGKKINYHDSVMFIYLLFHDRIILNSYSYYYKIIINSLSKILKIAKHSEKKQFHKFKEEIWIDFFNWLHEIEPSFLYSFFLYQYIDDFDETDFWEKIKMPALNFSPYFFAKCPLLANAIIKNYNLFMNSSSCQLKLKTYFIFVSPFFQTSFSKKIDRSKKGKLSNGTFKKIIKGRLNQSSHVSELNVNCFKRHVMLFKNNIEDFDEIESLFVSNHQQNLLAFDSIDSEEKIIYDQINPERDENMVYFGLPAPISLKTKQDYFNFNNKQVYMNYPLEIAGNAQLNYQIRSIKRTFKLDNDEGDDLNFLILTDQSHSNMLKHKNSILFRYLIRKFSDTRVPLQFRKEDSIGFNQREAIESSFQSIFNMKKFHEFYKCPFSLYFFSKILDDYFDKNNSNKKNEEANDPSGIKSKSVINFYEQPQKEEGTQNSKIKSKKKKNEKKQKKISNNTSIKKSNSIGFRKDKKKKEAPLFFIVEPTTPYFIIDSVSNFINRIFTYFNFHIENNAYFDIQYIKKKLLEDANINTNQNDKKTLDDMHIENIIKAALFANIYCKFQSMSELKNQDHIIQQIKLLSKSHILYLFIFYKFEEAKPTLAEKMTTAKPTLAEQMTTEIKYIQMLPEIKVIELTKHYICSKNNTSNEKVPKNKKKSKTPNINKKRVEE